MIKCRRNWILLWLAGHMYQSISCLQCFGLCRACVLCTSHLRHHSTWSHGQWCHCTDSPATAEAAADMLWDADSQYVSSIGHRRTTVARIRMPPHTRPCRLHHQARSAQSSQQQDGTMLLLGIPSLELRLVRRKFSYCVDNTHHKI